MTIKQNVFDKGILSSSFGSTSVPSAWIIMKFHNYPKNKWSFIRYSDDATHIYKFRPSSVSWNFRSIQLPPCVSLATRVPLGNCGSFEASIFDIYSLSLDTFNTSELVSVLAYSFSSEKASAHGV